MPSKIARTGKVKVPRYGVMKDYGELGTKLFTIDRDYRWCRQLADAIPGANLVRLSGTVTYTVEK